MKRKNENIHFMEIADLEQCVYGKETNKSIMMSIFCLTFNHKDYIGDALDGFVSQNIDFEYEIVIFDDASTDGTSDIIREYAQKYPKLIKAYLAHKNTFRHINRKEMQYEFQRHVLKGKYIALCEGDSSTFMLPSSRPIALFEIAAKLTCERFSSKATRFSIFISEKEKISEKGKINSENF